MIVRDVPSLVNIHIREMGFASNGGTQLIDEPIPIGTVHSNKSITFQC
jgi:hypothetical protein